MKQSTCSGRVSANHPVQSLARVQGAVRLDWRHDHAPAHYAQLVEEESTRTVMAGLREVVQTQGLFCALYSDRGSHFFHTSIRAWASRLHCRCECPWPWRYA